jgi:hypothetical protein
MPHIRRAESQNPLSKPLVVLRKVDFDKLGPASTQMIFDTDVSYLVSEGDLAWTRDGYVLNDQPRLFELTKEIMGATLGFAVAKSDTGEIIARYGPDGLKAAEAAVKGAKVQVVTDIEIELADDAAVEEYEQAQAVLAGE